MDATTKYPSSCIARLNVLRLNEKSRRNKLSQFLIYGRYPITVGDDSIRTGKNHSHLSNAPCSALWFANDTGMCRWTGWGRGIVECSLIRICQSKISMTLLNKKCSRAIGNGPVGRPVDFGMCVPNLIKAVFIWKTVRCRLLSDLFSGYLHDGGDYRDFILHDVRIDSPRKEHGRRGNH